MLNIESVSSALIIKSTYLSVLIMFDVIFYYVSTIPRFIYFFVSFNSYVCFIQYDMFIFGFGVMIGCYISDVILLGDFHYCIRWTAYCSESLYVSFVFSFMNAIFIAVIAAVWMKTSSGRASRLMTCVNTATKPHFFLMLFYPSM